MFNAALRALYYKVMYTEPNATFFYNNILVSGGATNFVSSPIEKGSVVTGIRFTWFYEPGMPNSSNPITGQSMPDYPGVLESGALNTTGLLDLGITADTTMPLNTNRTYVLRYGDARTPVKTISTSVTFLQKVYYGSNGNTSLNTSDILGLANQVFATSRQRDITFQNPGGAYLYIAYPENFGAATFRVNGLNNSAWIRDTVSFQNLSNYTENYYVYRSQFLQYGTNIRVEVL